MSSSMVAATSPRVSESEKARPRLAFVDNIRWMVIAMVVLVHACVTYSGLGSWYYHESVSLDKVSMLVFFAYEILSQAFFMGILFFIAAVFIPGAYDRKGPRRFLLDRLLRLGVPTLVFMLIIHPLTLYILARNGAASLGSHGFWSWYGSRLLRGAFLSDSGPLWFAFALLGFSVLYGLGRWLIEAIRGPATTRKQRTGPRPRAVHVAAVILMIVIGAGSFFVRLVQPVGTSWMNMQLCFFTQYVVLFAAGLWAGRNGFLQALPKTAGRVWFVLAFALGVPAWFLLMGFGGALTGGESLFLGGWHWQAVAFAGWEAFFCVAISLGLITVFRERGNARTAATGLLADTCFGIYVFHTPVLVGASMLIRAVALYPLAKALIAGASTWIVTLALAWMVRRIPAIGKLFA